MNLGTVVMKNILLGRPYMDYASDVLVLKVSGAPLGELNHSRKFAASFRSSLVKFIKRESSSSSRLLFSKLVIFHLWQSLLTREHLDIGPVSFCHVWQWYRMEVLTCVQPVVTQETRSLFLTVKRSGVCYSCRVGSYKQETWDDIQWEASEACKRTVYWSQQSSLQC